jgi:hypothetical protein
LRSGIINIWNVLRVRWAAHVARVAEMRNGCSILVWRSERKGRPRRRWDNNSKMDLKEWIRMIFTVILSCNTVYIYFYPQAFLPTWRWQYVVFLILLPCVVLRSAIVCFIVIDR